MVQKTLFWRKLLTTFVATILLVPLMHFQQRLPMEIFVAGLILLHVFFFAMYMYRVDWRYLRRNKRSFWSRLVMIGFLVFLLTLLTFDGSIVLVSLALIAAFFIHAGILTLLMMKPKLEA